MNYLFYTYYYFELIVYLLILTNKYIYNLKCQIVIGKIDFSYFINFSNYQILKNIND